MQDILLWGMDSLLVVHTLSGCGSQAPELVGSVVCGTWA